MGLADLRDEVRRAEAADKVAKIARNVEAVRRFMDECNEVVGQDVLDELQPQHIFDNVYGPIIYLTYRNNTVRFGSPSGGRGCKPISRKAIAEWCDKVDEEIKTFEADRAEARDVLISALMRDELPVHPDSDYTRRQLSQYKLEDDSDVLQALGLARGRIEARDAELEAKRKYDHDKLVQQALAICEQAHDKWDFHKINWEVEKDDQVMIAIAAAERRIDNARSIRESAQAAAQERADYKSVWYKVSYGIFADDEDGDRDVAMEFFPSLACEPDVNGWWTPADGKPKLKVAHLVKIERMVVDCVEVIPSFYPLQKVETEAGTVCVHVMPAGAVSLYPPKLDYSSVDVTADYVKRKAVCDGAKETED